MKLLILRPQPGGDATARRARDAGLEPVLMPLFAVEAVDWDAPAPGDYDALLITSANAIRHGGAALQALTELPVYAVGIATANEAAEAGFELAATGTEGGASLLSIAQAHRYKSLLWLAGADHIPLAPSSAMTIDTHVVYQSMALPAPPNFASSVQDDMIVALHSPRAARHFASLCKAHDVDRGAIRLACLSANISDAASKGWKQKIIADQPDDAALLSALVSCFTNPSSAP